MTIRVIDGVEYHAVEHIGCVAYGHTCSMYAKDCDALGYRNLCRPYNETPNGLVFFTPEDFAKIITARLTK